MKMLDRQEYDDLMSYLKPVFKKIWAHENDERQKVGKSLDAFQFGFPINNIWLYLTEKNGEKFYIIFNVSFFSMISDQIKQAQTQYPENFGTGNADDVMDALYQVSNYKGLGDKNAYLDYLVDHCCCYVVYRVNGEFGDVLRIDLLRTIKPNINTPEKNDVVGGLLHVLKHFSLNGKNLATGTDKNDVFDVSHIIYLIAMAFRQKKTVKGSSCKYEALQKLQSGTGHAVFYRNPDTGVYYLNTYFYNKRYL